MRRHVVEPGIRMASPSTVHGAAKQNKCAARMLRGGGKKGGENGEKRTRAIQGLGQEYGVSIVTPHIFRTCDLSVRSRTPYPQT